tara:strand:+ start:2190 stop:3659 length:1470 start_codon:yes stop_codon:yes gene_type:complete
MDYSIAIPSKGRSDIIKEKVLKLLESHSISKSKIFIFVEESELVEYKSKLTEYKIIKGASGIGKQREAISNYFPQNDFIVSFDDDVEQIYEHNKPIISIDLFIKDTFNLLLDNDLTLAGIYPTSNYFFCKNTITTDLRFCIGQLKIFINKKHLERRHYELLEDYENTLNHYSWASGVLRYNYITLKANYNSGKGGLKEYRTIERKQKEVEQFCKEFNQYSKPKKDGFEVSLIKNPVRDIIKSLWIGHYLNELSELCIMSWLRLNYKVELYIDKLNLPKYMDKYRQSGQLLFKSINEIMPYNSGEEILPYSDLFRYKMLFKGGGTWCDADMFLLKRLPKDDIIISSEHTFQSGAYKSKLTWVANIGVLRFPKGNQFLENLIFKIENKFTQSEFCDNMNIFRKRLKNHQYFDLVSPPYMYCPLAWWNCKESYYDDHYKIKYDVKNMTNTEMVSRAVGIHLWNNFTYNKHDIAFHEINDKSLYKILYNIIFN